MRYLKYWIILAGALTLFASAQTLASTINFENASGLGLGDNDQVTNQYASSDGVTFSGAFLEKAGGADDGPQGFQNGQTGQWDMANAGYQTPAPPGLGNWFLRSAGNVMERGGNNPLGIGDTFLSVLYDNPVTMASGQVWDIDGNSSQGSEEWTILAIDSITGDTVAKVVSPEYNHGGANNSLNGRPFGFSFNTSQSFDKIAFKFTGTKMEGIGLAFDNFSPYSAVAVAEPSVLWTFGLGLALLGLGVVSHRRRRGPTPA